MAVLHCTDRQVQILELAARGQSDKEIAVALGVSIHTVRTHLQRLYQSAGLANRAEAVAAWLAQQTTAPPADSGPLGAGELAQQEERVAAAAAASAAAQLPVQTVAAPIQADLVNQARTAAGLQPVEWDGELAAIAEKSACRMAAAGHLDTIIGDDGACAGRTLRAENVGYWSGINDAQLHALFAADPKQRGNILGAHRSVGAAWAVMDAGVAFLSVVFA